MVDSELGSNAFRLGEPGGASAFWGRPQARALLQGWLGHKLTVFWAALGCLGGNQGLRTRGIGPAFPFFAALFLFFLSTRGTVLGAWAALGGDFLARNVLEGRFRP